MKNLLLASLFTIALTSCNREEPPTPVTPVQPAIVHENYMVINGDGHNDDTLRFNSFLTGNVHGDSLDVMGSDTATIAYRLYDIDINQTSDSIFSPTFVNAPPHSYSSARIKVTVSSIGSIGGYIDGTYSGTFRRASSPFTMIAVSGKFSVIRN